ncbi:hypothetical protein [Pseudonocardia sp.]|nr:hypothetical protein [Pseudonocardia sp.]
MPSDGVLAFAVPPSNGSSSIGVRWPATTLTPTITNIAMQTVATM